VAPLLCSWCRIQPAPAGGRFCSRKCRQAAWRFRERSAGLKPAAGPGTPPGRFLYLDPPYVGTSAKYYSDQPSFAGEVDHDKMIAEAQAGDWIGWALSCSVRSLRQLLPICPEGARVCAWTKPIGVPPVTFGLHNTWEPLIVVGGRLCQPGIRDWLCAQPARLWGDLPGRKPVAFCAFLFDALGMLPGDELVDQFPGSGAVARAWREMAAAYSTQLDLFDVAASSSTSPPTSLVDGRRSPMASLLQRERPVGPRAATSILR
jgi:hypothetical protein